jgi:diaminopimelate epimerase
MEFEFYKYQGTGNDFIMIDNRNLLFPKNDIDLINGLCDRRFGIGADGLILLENSEEEDFTMVYYNADGREGSMCGNGGRCIVAFAKQLGIIENETTFNAIDGLHFASIENELVSLKMIDVDSIETSNNHQFLDTGSPHHINFLDDISEIDVKKMGAEIRYGAPYFETGTNVNFVEQIAYDTFKVRTYERGVEDETMACGTGVTAVAIAANDSRKTAANSIKVEVLGGFLEVSFKKEGNVYTEIYLKGPAEFVYRGKKSL